jgi:hypothetical protein
MSEAGLTVEVPTDVCMDGCSSTSSSGSDKSITLVLYSPPTSHSDNDAMTDSKADGDNEACEFYTPEYQQGLSTARMILNREIVQWLNH